MIRSKSSSVAAGAVARAASTRGLAVSASKTLPRAAFAAKNAAQRAHGAATRRSFAAEAAPAKAAAPAASAPGAITSPSGSFKVEMKPGGVAMVTMDLKGKPMNVLGVTFLEEMPSIVESLEKDAAVKVIVFISGKKDFIAGADIPMFAEVAVRGKEAVKVEVCQRAQGFFNAMEAGKPKIAAISGAALGGGCEFALACHYRVAAVNASIGTPEVQLGLLPGAGGTQRLPKLVGIQAALPMLMTGAAKKAKQAKSLKLVDMTCEVEQLESCALVCAQNIASGALKIPKRGEFKGTNGYVEKAIHEYSFARDYVFKQAKQQVMKSTSGNYPAPLQIINVLKKSIETKSLGKPKGYDLEADAFADLALTPESAGLKSLFFGSTALKKNPFKGAKPVKNIAVLGAGLMGAGIAEVSINKGFNVAMLDKFQDGLNRGLAQIKGNLDKKVKKKRATAWDTNIVASRLTGITNDMSHTPIHLGRSDLVIEAVFEDLGIKHQIIKEMETMVPKHCIIATNTSSLAVKDIAKGSSRPENVVGMHYFSPVDKMQLLEIIPHEGTSPEVVATAVQVGLKQGKMPVVVKDVAGFYVNRCLGPYIDESMTLAFEVENYLQMDKAIVEFGFPMGPMVLADEVGVDVSFHVHENLRPDLGERMGGANIAAMEAIKAAGIKGKRFGSGFISYPPEKKPSGLVGSLTSMVVPPPKKVPNPAALAAMKPFMKTGKVSDEDIQKRICARFVNEAIFCLQDGIIRNAVDGDMAAVFGVGFPPFTGGPFRYVDSVGSAKYCDHLQQLADTHGPRFKPAPLLVDMAKTNAKFHK